MNSGGDFVSTSAEISVVVPVYNVEKYLDRCVSSILNQTFTDYELILVDDGSTDNSGRLCDEIKTHDSRIEVLHKDNGGLSDARNCGTAVAHGKYIAYIDSDDYVTDDYLQLLHDMVVNYNADVAVGNFIEVNDGKELSSVDRLYSDNDIKVLTNREALHMLLATPCYLQMVTAWGKLIKADIAKNNPFPIGRLREDEATTYRYYINSEKTVVSNAEIYGYYQNSASIMRSGKNRKKTEDALWALVERSVTLEKSGFEDEAKRAWLFVYGWLYETISENPKERWTWKETYYSLQRAKYISNNIKLKSFIYMHFPYTFKMVQKLRGKEK